ncbi:MAG TPA: MFS transporter, partial [Stellaceae bacterium]|nr:MFS transporter [Stellaceae bacterium]
TGLGLGWLVPIGVAWLMEFLPERRRAAIVAAVISCFLGGWILASLAALVVIPHFGWRAFFAVGATPIVVAVILVFWGPESPSWLFARGKRDEALAVLARIGRQHPSTQALAQMETAPRTNWFALFSSQHFKSSLIIGAMYFLIAMVSAGITQWLPSMLMAHGISMRNTFIYFLVVSIGPVLGTIAMGMLLDVWGRRRCFIVFWIGASVFITLFAFITSPAGVMAFGFGLTSCTVATFSCLDVITAEIYPVELRASAIGFGMGLSRLGGASGPLLGGYLVAAHVGYTAFFLVFAVPPLINAVLAMKLRYRDGDETPHKLQAEARSWTR